MSYQGLMLDGNGWGRILDGVQQGLDMGLSDFMLEAWKKADPSGPNLDQRIISKQGVPAYYLFRLNGNGRLNGRLWDGANLAITTGTTDLRDGRWDYVCFSIDKSIATGLQLRIDGTEVAYTSQNSPVAVGNLDNNGNFYIGCHNGVSQFFYGLFDEIRIWNFGYGGLPADYAAYILWRSQGRHRFLPLSEYAAGAWNGYNNADRTELLTNGSMEAVNSWANRGAPTTNARSGVQQHGGAFSRLIVSNAVNQGARQDVVTVVGEWYEVRGWVWVTAGDAEIGKEDTDGSDQVLTSQATAAAWNEFCVVFQATAAVSRIFFQSDTVAVSTFYVDDMETRRIGKVTHYKFENNLLDETQNNNDLTTGGTGNLYPTYSLKREKIIMAGAVNPAMGDRR